MRKAVDAECLWCHQAISVTLPEDNLPAELLDAERPLTLETLARFRPLLPDMEGVDVLSLLDGRRVVIHTGCALALVCAVATGPDGTQRVQQLKDKDEQERKKR